MCEDCKLAGCILQPEYSTELQILQEDLVANYSEERSGVIAVPSCSEKDSFPLVFCAVLKFSTTTRNCLKAEGSEIK